MKEKANTGIAIVAFAALAILCLAIFFNPNIDAKMAGKATYEVSTAGNNVVTDNQASGNGENDFVIKGTDNVEVYGTTVSSNPTSFSFSEYEGDFYFKGVDTIPTAPSGKADIGKIIEVTGEGSLDLGIHYETSDVSGVDESTLQLYSYDEDSSTWDLVAGSYVDTVNNVVYGTLTEFSIFAPFGASTGEVPSGGEPGAGGGGGGGAGGETELVTIKLTRDNITGGELLSMSVGDVLTLIIEGEPHTARLVEVTPDYIVIEIMSPLRVTLREGEIKDVDVNENGVDDLRVELLQIIPPNSARVRFTALAEAQAEPVPTPIAMFTMQSGLLTAVVIILMAVGIIYAIRQEKKHKHTRNR